MLALWTQPGLKQERNGTVKRSCGKLCVAAWHISLCDNMPERIPKEDKVHLGVCLQRIQYKVGWLCCFGPSPSRISSWQECMAEAAHLVAARNHSVRQTVESTSKKSETRYDFPGCTLMACCLSLAHLPIPHPLPPLRGGLLLTF